MDTHNLRDRPLAQITKRDLLDVIEGIDGRARPVLPNVPSPIYERF
jgi:hypothetical protein